MQLFLYICYIKLYIISTLFIKYRNCSGYYLNKQQNTREYLHYYILIITYYSIHNRLRIIGIIHRFIKKIKNE